MIQEEYVSFETAKLLKEKGFVGTGEIGSTCGYYEKSKINGEINLVYDDLDNNELEYDTSVEAYLRTTQQIAMRWLREVHNIEICVNIGLIGKDHKKMYDWCPVIVKENRLEYPITYPDGSCSVLADSYEEAVEAGIKYALENLI